MQSSVQLEMFSTGTVQIRPEHVGPTRLPALAWLLISRTWTKPRPINVYVAKHPQGNVVFDTGQDLASVTDPSYFPKGLLGWLYSRLARFAITQHETFEKGLSDVGIKLKDVDYVVLSHLHQDHIGGLRSIAHRKTRVFVDRRELEAAQKPGAVFDGYLDQHIHLPGVNFESPTYQLLPEGMVPGFTHGWDLFGDGLIVLLPLSGHTKGSLGMLINLGHRSPVLLVGDLTYDFKLMLKGIVPGVGRKSSMHSASAQVLELIASFPELVVAAAHDPNVMLPKQ